MQGDLYIYDLVYSFEHLNLQYCTQLEVLTLSRCTPSILRRNGLAIIDKVSSSHFREFNISILSHQIAIDSVLAENQPQLAAVDARLQQPNFGNLERLTIGLPPDVANSMQDFFPHTAARNLLRVMSIDKIDELPAFTNGQGSL